MEPPKDTTTPTTPPEDISKSDDILEKMEPPATHTHPDAVVAFQSTQDPQVVIRTPQESDKSKVEVFSTA